MDDHVDLDEPEGPAHPADPADEPSPDTPSNDDPRAVSPPRPDPPSGPRRQLRRRTDDRIVAGVASGLAESFDVSPLAVRTLFGFAALVVAFDGFGDSRFGVGGLFGLGGVLSALATATVFAYVVLWIVVPRDDADETRASRLAGRFPRMAGALGIVAVLAGAAVLGGQLGLWDDGLAFPLLLIVGGVLLYRRDAVRSAADSWMRGPEPPPGTTAAEPAATASAAAIAPPATATGASSGTPTLPLPVVSSPRPPRPPRERSPLGWLGLGIALLIVGGAAILQNLGAIDLPLVRYPAIFLLILGATMLVGAFAGRARWLVLPALLVVPIVLTASLIRVPIEGGIGDTRANPQSSSAVEASYRRVIGGIYLDLSALKGTDAQPVVAASTGIGEITIVVPFDAHVVATGRAGIGMVSVGPVKTERVADAFIQTTWDPRVGDGSTITLDLETGIGDVHVIRNAPTPRDLRELEAA